MDDSRSLFLTFAATIAGVGCLMVFSASVTSWPSNFEQVYLSRHLTFLVLGIIAGFVCAMIPAATWARMAPWLFAGAACLLLLVLVPGVGTKVNGSQRWFRFGRISLQPSEIMKLALPLLLARMAVRLRQENALASWRGLWKPVVPIGLAAALVFVEPDFGTAAFLCAGAAILLWSAKWPVRNFLLGIVILVPVATWLVTQRSYQLQRVTGFLNAWSNFEESPYQLKQSLLALGSGGVNGIGVGKGWQKLSFLPEANTDFVFSVIGEELGLVGTLSLCGLWLLLYLTGLRMLWSLPKNSFAFLAGFTLLTQIVLQAALNVAVVTAMVPPKGIPHPLVSYGGSNLVCCCAALGIVIAFSRDRRSIRPA